MKTKLTALAALTLFSASSFADIRFNGFASIVGGSTTAKDESYLNYEDKLTFKQDSLFALQMTADMSEGLTAVGQLVARGQEGYEAGFEWAYLGYEINDQLSIKAGRIRNPAYYYSEFLEVGYAYHWLRPPNELYQGSIKNVEGFSLNYSMYTGDIEHQFQYVRGTKENWIKDDPTVTQQRYDLNMSVNWEMKYNNFGLKLLAATGDLYFNNEDLEQLGGFFAQAGFNDLVQEYIVTDGYTNRFTGAAGNYDNGNWFAIIEYSELDWNGENALISDESRFFLSGGVRMNDMTYHYSVATRKNEPATFIQDMVPNVDALKALYDALGATIHSTGLDIMTHTFGVRYDFHPAAAFKTEVSIKEDSYENPYNAGAMNDATLIRFGVDMVF